MKGPTMYRVCLVFAAGLLLATAVHAASRWNGEGWYQTLDHSVLGNSTFKMIYLGPYDSEANCLKVLHPDYVDPGLESGDPDELNDFSCTQLNTRPAWDN
jgi:hypothetical protein